MNFYTFTAEIAKKLWGFNPNRDIKPVHLANGFFKNISGVTNNISLLQNAAAGYIKGSSGNTNNQILADLRDAYTVDVDEDADLLEKVGELRTALDLVLTQDKALYGNFTSSATLSHYLLTSSDPSDNATGKFLTQLLANMENKEVLITLRQVLADDKDNVYLLTSPLLSPKSMGPEPVVEEEIKLIMQNAPYLYSVQEAFLNLTRYKNKLEKTIFLQRVVNLGCFSIYLHLLNRNFSLMNKDNLESPEIGLVPIFLASNDPSKEIREVSRATFARGRQQIEIAYENELKKAIKKDHGENISKDNYIKLVTSMLPEIDNITMPMNRDTQIWNRFIEDFEGNLLGITNVDEAFYKSFVRTAFSYFNTSSNNSSNPETVATFIGKNIGLVYPREGGRGDKYYLPGPRFLDTLVGSLLNPDDEVSIEEFWDMAWKKFGIVTGARGTKDIERLSRWGIRQVSPKHASQNAKKITSELIRMGYVTEYADDIAMIRGGGVSNG